MFSWKHINGFVQDCSNALELLQSCFNSLRQSGTLCVYKLTIIDSDKGLSLRRHQAIIWTNAGLLLIGPLGTNFSEILIEIFLHFNSIKCIWKCRLENGGPSCFCLNVLSHRYVLTVIICSISAIFVSATWDMPWLLVWAFIHLELRRLTIKSHEIWQAEIYGWRVFQLPTSLPGISAITLEVICRFWWPILSAER